MNDQNKVYVWGIVSNMQDGDEFTDKECNIDWEIFKSYIKRVINARVLWPKDIMIGENGKKIKCIR